MEKQKGFTLVELVVVIIILGILAVTAAPKFINMQSDAYASTLKGLEGAINGANVMVYGKAALQGETNNPSAEIDIDSTTKIATAYGYTKATKDNIENILDIEFDEYPGTDGSNEWIIKVANSNDHFNIWQRNAPRDTNDKQCKLIYKQPAKAGEVPSIEVVTTGC